MHLLRGFRNPPDYTQVTHDGGNWWKTVHRMNMLRIKGSPLRRVMELDPGYGAVSAKWFCPQSSRGNMAQRAAYRQIKAIETWMTFLLVVLPKKRK